MAKTTTTTAARITTATKASVAGKDDGGDDHDNDHDVGIVSTMIRDNRILYHHHHHHRRNEPVSTLWSKYIKTSITELHGIIRSKLSSILLQDQSSWMTATAIPLPVRYQ